jgi:hypothetical protein
MLLSICFSAVSVSYLTRNSFGYSAAITCLLIAFFIKLDQINGFSGDNESLPFLRGDNEFC